MTGTWQWSITLVAVPPKKNFLIFRKLCVLNLRHGSGLKIGVGETAREPMLRLKISYNFDAF